MRTVSAVRPAGRRDALTVRSTDPAAWARSRC